MSGYCNKCGNHPCVCDQVKADETGQRSELSGRTGSAFFEKPLNDGRQWECQCARCGSSVDWHECESCGGEGITGPGELYDEDPLWYDHDDYEPCHQCGGQSSWAVCLSGADWCQGHPMPGRENVERGRIEWFPLSMPNNGDVECAGEARPPHTQP